MKKVLLVGETWFTHTIHVKGFDMFTESSYGEGAAWLKEALKNGGFEVNHVANHKVVSDFPYTLEELQEYDVIILSDIGSNTLLLPESTFRESKVNANRCDLIKEYVEAGGGLCMVGGYMAFTGIDAKARYGETAIAEVTPVKMLEKDDRFEAPQGIVPVIKDGTHQIFDGIEGEFPHFLGYNMTIEDEKLGKVIATINGDPFIAVGEYGKGRGVAFTSDCAPHWGPKEFVEWKYYDKLWQNIVNWLAGEK